VLDAECTEAFSGEICVHVQKYEIAELSSTEISVSKLLLLRQLSQK
jgi:hypothetical protein